MKFIERVNTKIIHFLGGITKAEFSLWNNPALFLNSEEYVIEKEATCIQVKEDFYSTNRELIEKDLVHELMQCLLKNNLIEFDTEKCIKSDSRDEIIVYASLRLAEKRN